VNANQQLIGETMDIACRAGKIILENGGETYRVEETMLYICRSYGMEESECYATPTSIMISIIDEQGKVHTRMMRILSRGINLCKVEAVNEFSRSIMKNPIPIPAAKAKLQEISETPPYPLWLTIIAAGLATSAFTVIFGGTLAHFLCGLLTGAALRLIALALERIQLGYFTTILICAAAATIGGWTLASAEILPEWWIITFATIMLLVPGLLFTNALRDTVAGDLLSGISRGVEALSIAAALGFGAAAALMILRLLGSR